MSKATGTRTAPIRLEPLRHIEAEAFDNPDCVDVVIHSYRHRLGHADGARAYVQLETALAQLPPISVPAVTADAKRARERIGS
jgi:hypothetical protein